MLKNRQNISVDRKTSALVAVFFEESTLKPSFFLEFFLLIRWKMKMNAHSQASDLVLDITFYWKILKIEKLGFYFERVT